MAETAAIRGPELARPLQQRCKVCGLLDKFDYHVPDEVWEKIVPPRYRTKVVCLPCFDELAFEKQVNYSDSLDVLYFAGDRAVFKFRAISSTDL